LADRRRTARAKDSPTAAPAPIKTVKTFVVTQVRQALQQAVAAGACSPYLAASSPTRTVTICLMRQVYGAF
jgi:hypothetical protein